MIPRQSVVAVCIIVCVYLVTGCTKEDVAQPGQTYIPQITGDWANTTDPNNIFNFQVDTLGVARSTFSGTESRNFAEVGRLIGSFANRNITFTVETTLTGGRKTYTGRFTLDTLMDLGSLKLSKQPI